MGCARIADRLVVGWLTAAMVLSVGVAGGQERGKVSTKQRQGWWERETAQTELGLSSNQVKSIDAIEERNRELTQQNRKAQQQAYRQMIRLLTAEAPSEAEIADSRQAIEEAWAKSTRLTVDYWIELRDVLSAEQWELLPQVAPRALQLGGLRTRLMGNITIGEQGE